MAIKPQASKAGQLRKDAITVIGAVALAMAFMGPATSVFFNTQPAAIGAGFALPFALLLAMIVATLVASTIGAFAKKIPTAGFAYTFNTHGFGKRGGFLSGWILVFAYAMVGPMLLAAIGELTAEFVHSLVNLSIPWWAFTIVFAAIVWAIGISGVSRTAATALIFLALEVGVMLALFLTILFFVGFESAGTLGQETQNARRSIPIALFTAVGVIGVFYVLSAWVGVLGYGQSHMGTFVGDSSPWITLTQKFWGPNLIWLVSLTVLNSIFANLISGINATVRVIFAMGREGIVSSRLGRTTARGNPFSALTAYMLFALVLALLGGALWTPLGAYGFFGTLLGLGLVIIYILMNLALIIFYRRDHRAEFSLVRHGILPVVASLLMLLPIYGLLWPIPTYPNNLVPYIMLVWLLLGGIYLFVIVRRQPELLDAMGRVMVNDTPKSNEQQTVVAD